MPNDINEMKKFVNNVKKLVEKKVNNAKTDTSKKAIVQSLNEDGTAKISMNNQEYDNIPINAGLSPQINETVEVKIPLNNLKDMYICKCNNSVSNLDNVLTKDNTITYTPTSPYNPATKKYVDDSVASAGGGDMLVSIYDTDNDGKVEMADNADTVNGHTVNKDVPSDAVFTYPVVTNSVNGLMSSIDKTKLDSIEENANKYVLPVATDSILGGIKVGSNFSITSDGILSLNDIINIINLSTETAQIKSAKIEDLNADKITAGDISTERLSANVINAINSSISTAYIEGAKIKEATINTAQIKDAAITNAKIADLDAIKITAGDIETDRLIANVINAINLTTSSALISSAKIENLNADKIISGDISTDRLVANVINAINLSTSTATIQSARIEDLDASKIISGDIDAQRLIANVINAINLSTDTAVISSAKIENLDASKIISGDIETDRLLANIISAINLSANDAYINGAKIENATIGDAKIINLDASKLTSGIIDTTILSANIIDAINASFEDAVINSAKIGDLDANKIISGNIATDRLSANVINAINANVESTKISSAKIADLDASKIVSGDISTDRLVANVIDAINMSSETAIINSAKIASLDASKIVSGDISTDRLVANVINAINLSTSTAMIQSARIDNLDASKIVSGIIDTSKVRISNSITGSGARLDFIKDGMFLYDDSNNIMLKITINDGLVTHVPGGIKIDNGGSLRIGATEDIVIDSEGLKSKAGGDNYTGFFTGDGLRFEDPNDSLKQVIIKSGEIRLTRDGGQTSSTAMTPQGIYGNLLLNNTVTPDKFDTTPPAIPTWRDEGLVSIIEQTAETQIVSIIVKWNEVSDSDLEGYKIYVAEDTGNFYPIAIVGKTNQYKIRGLKSNTTYKVKVSSFDIQGNECNTAMPIDSILTTYQKTIVTVKDTIPPAQPQSAPTIINGLKSFAIKWNPITKNTDNSDCNDLAFYEIQRYSAQTNTWETISTISGTNLIDDDVQYDIQYKYRYRAIDLSGNVSGWSPETILQSPSKIGASDIVAHSITTDLISTEGLDAKIITSGKISGDFIEANTITADVFESKLHGDLTQSIRYIEGKLKNKIYEWTNTQENYDAGTYYHTYAYNGILMLDTKNHWSNDGVNWDSNAFWGEPTAFTEGYWESPILSMNNNDTVLNIPKFSYHGNAGATITVYARYSEDNITWTEYEAITAEITTCKYFQFKIELKILNVDKNVYIDTFSFQFFIDTNNIFPTEIIIGNKYKISYNPDGDSLDVSYIS